MQKEKLKIEQKKLHIEKQRLDFERIVGAQLITLVPMVSEILKQLSPGSEEILTNGETSQEHVKRKKSGNDKDVNAKYLKSMIQERIKKYIMGDNNSEEDSDDDVDLVENENSNNSNASNEK